MSRCIAPAHDGENQFYVGEHDYDRDGFCVVCGDYNPREKESKNGKNSKLSKDF